ncbi:MAG: hypothetical protein WAL50_12460 [Kineosporiaceae bacterium]
MAEFVVTTADGQEHTFLGDFEIGEDGGLIVKSADGSVVLVYREESWTDVRPL